jgi:hypothetical protein
MARATSAMVAPSPTLARRRPENFPAGGIGRHLCHGLCRPHEVDIILIPGSGKFLTGRAALKYFSIFSWAGQ